MTEKILIRAPANLKATLQSTAKSRGHTLNSLILQILWEWENTNPTRNVEKETKS